MPGAGALLVGRGEQAGQDELGDRGGPLGLGHEQVVVQRRRGVDLVDRAVGVGQRAATSGVMTSTPARRTPRAAAAAAASRTSPGATPSRSVSFERPSPVTCGGRRAAGGAR